MYVTYDYYASEFSGKLSEEEFDVAERYAETYIRSVTYVRGDIFATDSDMVRDAVCAVADVYGDYSKTKAESGVKKSENNDGYSVTFVTEQADGQTVEEVRDKKAHDVARMYLLPTGWLSRKVGCCYDHERRYDHL